MLLIQYTCILVVLQGLRRGPCMSGGHIIAVLTESACSLPRKLGIHVAMLYHVWDIHDFLYAFPVIENLYTL